MKIKKILKSSAFVLLTLSFAQDVRALTLCEATILTGGGCGGTVQFSNTNEQNIGNLNFHNIAMATNVGDGKTRFDVTALLRNASLSINSTTRTVGFSGQLNFNGSSLNFGNNVDSGEAAFLRSEVPGLYQYGATYRNVDQINLNAAVGQSIVQFHMPIGGGNDGRSESLIVSQQGQDWCASNGGCIADYDNGNVNYQHIYGYGAGMPTLAFSLINRSDLGAGIVELNSWVWVRYATADGKNDLIAYQFDVHGALLKLGSGQSVSPVPEPATVGLLAGSLVLGAYRKRAKT